jgi:hypothetical protein
LSQLIEAGKDTTKMFDFVDEGLDQMTFTIHPFIVIPFLFGSLMGWNDNFDAVFSQPIDKILSGIAAIRSSEPTQERAIWGIKR